MKLMKKSFISLFLSCLLLFLICIPQKVEAGVTGSESGSPVNFVTSSLTNLTSSNSSDAYSCPVLVGDGEESYWAEGGTAVDYTATLTPSSNYTLPASITVKLVTNSGQTLWTNGNQYTYNSSTGHIFISKDKIQSYIDNCNGAITIIATGVVTSTTSTNSTYKITVTQSSNGAISPQTTSGIKANTSKTFTIVASPGYKIKDVVIDGKSQGAIGTYTFSNIKASHTITATFEKKALNITVIQGENGVINPETAQNIQPGSEQVFSITPNKGYSIKSVLVDGQSVGIVNIYTFTDIQADHTITATYEEKLYEIVVNQKKNGNISPNTVTGLKYGSNQAFKIKPLKDYKIKDVVVDGKSQGAISTYNFKNIQTNHTVTATFVKQSHLLCWLLFIFLLLLLLLLIIWIIKRIIDKSQEKKNNKEPNKLKKKSQSLHKLFHSKKNK